MSDKEEQKLLGDREDHGAAIPVHVQKDAQRPKNPVFSYIYDHRSSIPGSGMLMLVRGSSVYALYVLLILLVAYLFNQLDRYTLPIVTPSAGYDLGYGDLACMKNRQVPQAIFDSFNVTSKTTDICKDDKYLDDEFNETIILNVKGNESVCLNSSFLVFSNESDNFTLHVCEYSHTGTGLVYQILAGPVFNNLYPLAGLFTGFLADYGRRTLWLAISLLFWSAVTALTGFAKVFWHLVLLRALLAIGAAGCNPFAVSLIGDYFPAAVRGSAISIYYFGIYIGYSLAFAIGSGIEEVLNWRWVFFLCGMAGIVVAPILLLTVREPQRKTNPLTDSTSEGNKLPFGKRIVALVKTFIMPGMLVLCIAGGVRNAGGYVWAYNTELFFEASGYSPAHIRNFMSWIPLVGGSIGAVVGGVISDVLVKGRGPYMRIIVLIVSQICAAPFALGALLLPSPWCFLSLIPSNVIGEMWIGVTSAIVVDLAPSKIRTAAIGLYLFIITVIGGNFNLVVEPIRSAFANNLSDLASYRWALSLTYPGVYALSSILFLLAFFLMRLDLKLKAKVEGSLMVNEQTENGRGQDSSGDEVEDGDKPV